MVASQRSYVFGVASLCFRARRLLVVFAFFLLLAAHSWAGAGGSVSGTVKDVSGAVVANASVTATDLATGVQHKLATNGQGYYFFPDLPVGRYDLTIQAAGFKTYQRTGTTINANSAVVVDAVLQVGGPTQAVSVSENAAYVETSGHTNGRGH